MTNQVQTYTTVRVPMNKAKPAADKIDLRDLSESDLDVLRREDPFMYHSIPSVYRATLRLEDVDHSALVPPKTPEEKHYFVSRKSIISTETDMVNVIDDLLMLSDEEFRLNCEELGIETSDLEMELAQLGLIR